MTITRYRVRQISTPRVTTIQPLETSWVMSAKPQSKKVVWLERQAIEKVQMYQAQETPTMREPSLTIHLSSQTSIP